MNRKKNHFFFQFSIRNRRQIIQFILPCQRYAMHKCANEKCLLDGVVLLLRCLHVFVNDDRATFFSFFFFWFLEFLENMRKHAQNIYILNRIEMKRRKIDEIFKKVKLIWSNCLERQGKCGGRGLTFDFWIQIKLAGWLNAECEITHKHTLIISALGIGIARQHSCTVKVLKKNENFYLIFLFLSTTTKKLRKQNKIKKLKVDFHFLWTHSPKTLILSLRTSQISLCFGLGHL